MTAIPARFAAHVGRTVRDLPAPAREELHDALLRACRDPWSWPQADTYELDETVRVITTSAAIVHYAVLTGADPHLWVFAVVI
ncbi:hypothetical protein OG897_33990 [Streptomyces sp. NBC_00237]|uniref:hypothetical protein n=1 Tax=Streptomyces sp. NBC_00237 TaxID=2975687 RepID=UPI00225C01AC|nr:hypothetical protein [Streptomyces sp. NBC_00237]MCX5206407.1 hypothetical protein [Streptomyces sp. NBC_00237]